MTNSAHGFDPLILCDVAACLWEAALDILHDAKHPAHSTLNGIRANYGTATLRDSVTSLSIECEKAWLALGDEGQETAGCFDWDFCPDWLCKKMAWPSR